VRFSIEAAGTTATGSEGESVANASMGELFLAGVVPGLCLSAMVGLTTSRLLKYCPDSRAHALQLLTRIDDRRYADFMGDLVRILCSELDGRSLQLLEDWMASGDEKRFVVVNEVLRAGSSELLYQHGPVIRRMLQRAKDAGRQVHRGLTRALMDASISGVRAGRPGEPFAADTLLKAHAEEQMARLSRVDAAYELYRELHSYAGQSIDLQLRQGRLMDEEDEA